MLEIADRKSVLVRAPNTRRAYATAFADFQNWCAERGRSALPAEGETLRLFLADRSFTVSLATLRLRIAAVNHAHKERGEPAPSGARPVRDLMIALERERGAATKRKTALQLDDLVRALATIEPSTLRGTRDRAMLLLGFFGAFRRSELAALNVEDLRFCAEGVDVTLRRSKTDQRGKTRGVPVPNGIPVSICAVRATKAWIVQAGISSGPLFRTITHGAATSERIGEKALARLVQRTCAAAHIDGDFGGHSLRAGFVSDASEQKSGFVAIASVTGHRSKETVDRYDRRADRFALSPAVDIMRAASRRAKRAR